MASPATAGHAESAATATALAAAQPRLALASEQPPRTPSATGSQGAAAVPPSSQATLPRVAADDELDVPYGNPTYALELLLARWSPG
jgi:hypothetical protein